jgi:hypothetical protein
VGNAFRIAISNGRDQQSAIAVTHEDDARQLLSLNDSPHIINVRCEPNGRGDVVSTVADR